MDLKIKLLSALSINNNIRLFKINLINYFLQVFINTPFAPFGPCVEKAGNNQFLTDFPINILKNSSTFQDRTIIFSDCENEGLYPLAGIYNDCININISLNHTIEFYKSPSNKKFDRMRKICFVLRKLDTLPNKAISLFEFVFVYSADCVFCWQLQVKIARFYTQFLSAH